MATKETRRVQMTATMPVGNPDRGAEVDIEVTADVDMSIDDALDAVTFIEPTLRDLTDLYRDSAIDRLMVEVAERATRDEAAERAAGERSAQLCRDFLNASLDAREAEQQGLVMAWVEGVAR